MSYYNSKNIQVFPTSKRDDKYTLTSKSGAYLSNIVEIKNRLVDNKSYVLNVNKDTNNKLNAEFYLGGYYFKLIDINLSNYSLDDKYLQAHIKLTNSEQIETGVSLNTLIDIDKQDLTTEEPDNNFYYYGLDLQINDREEKGDESNYYVTLLYNGEKVEDSKLHINERSLVIDDGEFKFAEVGNLKYNDQKNIITGLDIKKVFYINEEELNVYDYVDGNLYIRPDNVTSIGDGAFSGCSNLEKISLPFVGDKVHTQDDKNQYPFGYIFGTSRYTGSTATSQLYYGSSTDSIVTSTFYIPDSLKEVIITGCTYIPYGAFSRCTNLTGITIGNSVTSISSYAFYNCSSLINITFEENSQLTSIGDYAFQNCSSLTSIIIPDSVTSIGEFTFVYCRSLIIYCETTSKPSGWNPSWNGSNQPVYWYSKTHPTEIGNYWHYNDVHEIEIWE